MHDDAIWSLKPNVSCAAVTERFLSRGVGRLLRRAFFGELRSVADVYVPFRLYHTRISNGRAEESRWLALDGVNGSLDLYEFDHVPQTAEMARVVTRNRPEPALEEARARDLLAEKLRRLIFQKGFFRVRDLQISAELVPLSLHVPYWLGFYGHGESVRLRVVDAVRGSTEGAKARAFFEGWLAK